MKRTLLLIKMLDCKTRFRLVLRNSIFGKKIPRALELKYGKAGKAASASHNFPWKSRIREAPVRASISRSLTAALDRRRHSRSRAKVNEPPRHFTKSAKNRGKSRFNIVKSRLRHYREKRERGSCKSFLIS